MKRAEEYLRRASDADATAEKLTDPDIRRQFREIAAQWRVMARQAQEGVGARLHPEARPPAPSERG